MTDNLRDRIIQIIINAVSPELGMEWWTRDWIDRHITDLVISEIWMEATGD